ncbi:MAG TPA: hypothetical protein VFU15_03225, partial [Bacteroidia bacterium]|nr:hypothetical protein [Bacteroidia bacterium]
GSTGGRRGRRGSGGRGSTRGRQSSSASSSQQEAEALAAPVIAAPAHPVDAVGMVLHYHGAIAWANAQGTYSDEFHFVRNNPAAARLLLQNGGMTAAAALAFTQQFAVAVQHFGQQLVGYVPAEMQEQILNTLGAQEQLLAVIRYLQHGGGEEQQQPEQRQEQQPEQRQEQQPEQRQEQQQQEDLEDL